MYGKGKYPTKELQVEELLLKLFQSYYTIVYFFFTFLQYTLFLDNTVIYISNSFIFHIAFLLVYLNIS